MEEVLMTDRRDLIVLGMFAATALLPATASAAGSAPAGDQEAVGAALLDKYVAAVNAHDTSTFGEIHAESYIQHSGRSADGLAAQIENFRGIFARMPRSEEHTSELQSHSFISYAVF